MNRIKRLFLSLFGERNYLYLLAFTFQRLYRRVNLGIAYQDLYFLGEFVKPGDYCVDIGAHLGYYTMELSRLAGDGGKVFAIEPMSSFNEVLQALLRAKHRNNVEVYRVALGGEGEYVEMGIPELGRMKKFAYARVMQSSAHLQYVESEQVKNESGDNLFKALPRLDFIKCDVEGLEVSVFASMLGALSRHHPVILCELADQSERIKLAEMIGPLGYRAFVLKNKKCHSLDVHSDEKAISHNHYFIPVRRLEEWKHLMA